MILSKEEEPTTTNNTEKTILTKSINSNNTKHKQQKLQNSYSIQNLQVLPWYQKIYQKQNKIKLANPLLTSRTQILNDKVLIILS